MQLFSIDEPHIIGDSRPKRKAPSVVRTLRVNRILAFLIALSLLVLGGAITFACISSKYVRISGKTYYFVQFSTHENLTDAQAHAEQNRRHGGAGYVLNDGMFRVMGACYLSEGDAISVAEKQENGASVYKVTAAAIRRPVVEDRTANAAVKAAFALHETTFTDIQAVLYAYDQGLQSESVLYKALTDKMLHLKQQRERMESHYEQTARAEFKLLAENLTECSGALSNAVMGTGGTLSARVKHALIEIVLHRAALSIAVGAL